MFSYLRKNLVFLSLGIVCVFYSDLAIALDPQDIAQDAQQVTVKITNSGVVQSGILLTQDDNTYWVLTCTPKQKSAFNQVQVVTSDNQSYSPLITEIIQLEQFSVSLIPIKVNRSYQTANLGDSNSIKLGQKVYIAGFMQPGSSPQDSSQFLFTDGIVSSVVKQPNKSGFTHTSQIYSGMEGNPIFNQQGMLIGVYCQNYPVANRQKKDIQLNWGIPINSITEYAQQKGLTFGFSALGSPPPSPEEGNRERGTGNR